MYSFEKLSIQLDIGTDMLSMLHGSNALSHSYTYSKNLLFGLNCLNCF